MAPLTELLVVFTAGLITGLATGLGVAPFFFVDEIADRWIVVLWGLACGILLSASLFGLIREGIADGDPLYVAIGVLSGIGFVLLADRAIAGYEFTPRSSTRVTPKTLVLTVAVLTIHSVPEGIAVGVAFADMGSEPGISIGGVDVPGLAVFMSVAISILNVPEGLAIAIPLVAYGMSRWKVVGWAVFSGLPQPIGAVVAYYFVTTVRELLPLSFGFAAGALLYLVFLEFLPAGVEYGSSLANRGITELVTGACVGFSITLGLVLAVG